MKIDDLVFDRHKDRVWRVAGVDDSDVTLQDPNTDEFKVLDIRKNSGGDDVIGDIIYVLVLLQDLIPLAKSLWAAIKRVWISAFGSDEQKRALAAWKRAGKPR